MTPQHTQTMNYPEQKHDAPPAREPAATGEFWRRAGFELVMRCGTPKQIAGARARLQEVLAVRRNVESFFRRSEAA